MGPQIQPRTAHGDLPLTPQQLKVWALMARGLTNKEICRELGLGDGTVRAHTSEVLRRTGTGCRVKAALQWHGIAA